MTHNFFINVSEIELGNSAVLGENYLWFYIIQLCAIIIISISMVSCASVIISIASTILASRNEESKVEFVDRFPFYLAVADFLWGCSNLPAHLYILVIQKYPSSEGISLLISIIMSTFLGYQQLMHAGLAIYTYLGVVHWKHLDLGRGEWKLHLICGGLMILSIVGLVPFNAFGPSGYWMHQNVRTKGGIAFCFYVSLSVALQAFCTVLGYRSIQRVIHQQKQSVGSHISAGQRQDRHSTASECLATFVLISICLYCPLALIVLAFSIEATAGYIDPLTSLLIVVIGNSSGWANAVGYFRNRRIKLRHVKNIKDGLKHESRSLGTEVTSSC